MVRELVIASILHTVASLTYACDLYNCFLAINPNYNQNMIGVRYMVSRYKGDHSHFSMNENDGYEHVHDHNHSHEHEGDHQRRQVYERFNRYEIWGRLYPAPTLQVMFSLPYMYNYEMEGNIIKKHISGVGDALVVAQYQLFNSMPDTVERLRHRMFLGGGAKLPTGVYKKMPVNGTYDPLMEPGSGAFDALFSLSYMAKYKAIGFNTDILFRKAGKNDLGYVFADRFNVTSSVFYTKKSRSFTLIPSIGIYVEQAGMDTYKTINQQNTGGLAVFANTGLDIYFKQFSANVAYQVVLYEDLHGEQGNNQNRIVLGINYTFN